MATKQKLRKDARLYSGLESDGLRSDAEVDRVIEESYWTAARAARWPFLRDEEQATISSGEDRYTLDTLEVFDTVALDGRMIHEVAPEDVDRFANYRPASGTPFCWTRVAEGELRVFPVPEDEITLQVRGFKKPQGLVGDTDEPEWDESFHPFVSYSAAVRLLLQEGQLEDAEALRSEAGGFLDLMIQHYQPVAGWRAGFQPPQEMQQQEDG